MSFDGIERKRERGRRSGFARRARELTREPEAVPRSSGVHNSPESSEETARLVSAAKAERVGFKRTGGVARALWIAFGVVAVIVAGTAAVFVWQFNRAGRGVEIAVDGPREVYRGVPFELTVNIANQMDGVLSSAALNTSVPQGIVRLDTFGEQGALVSDSVGDLGSGTITKKTFHLFAVGEVGSSYRIPVALTYQMGRSQFEVGQKYEVAVSKSPISVDVQKPEYILRGSEFDLTISYENTSTFDFPEVFLEVQYPSAFRFVSATLTPDSLNNYWRLGALNAGSKGNIKVRGAFQGVLGEQLSMQVALSVGFLGKTYAVATAEPTFSMAPSPVALNLLVNGSATYVARIGDRLRYGIQYQNVSGIALADFSVRASFAGELFDVSSMQTDGGFDPMTNSITWNATTLPGLRLVESGSSGELDFEVRLKPTFSIKRLGDKNFVLRLNVVAESPSVPYYLAASKTSAAANLETKVGGLIFLDAKAFYRDALAGIANSGAMPPRAGQPTQYTVHWIIRNYATDVRDIAIKAALEPGVSWTGIVKSNIDSVPLYHEDTREMAWTIDRVAATRGVLSDPIEVIFQLQAVPQSSSIGQFQPLMSAVTLKAVDDFTGLELLSGDIALTTALPDDVTVGQGGGRVLP